MKRIWKEFRHTGYWVSDRGEVYSPFRVFLKPYKRGNGYLGVDIRKEKFLLHRVVAEAFIDNPYRLEIVNHIDGNKHNNVPSNLEWVDRSYNQIHAYRNGLQKKMIGSANHNSKPVIMLNKDTLQELMIFPTLTDAASFVHVKSIGGISKCCNGKANSVGGFKWKWGSN